MHWYGEGYMGSMGIWWIVGVTLIALVVWALVWAARGAMNGSSESPEQVLKRRYAGGEVDHETYQRILTELKG